MASDPSAARAAEAPGPNELRDPFVRQELKRAIVWVGLVGGVALAVVLVQPLLLIFGAIVFAAMLDGGARLLGRVAPVGRGWRLLIVMIGVILFLAWTVYLTGSQIAAQFEALRIIVTAQVDRLMAWATAQHLLDGNQSSEIGKQIMGSVGRVTSVLGSAVGAITSGAMIVVLGVFLAIEPRLYERGLAWMFPVRTRARLYRTLSDMGHTLRRLMAGRLLGMAVEGVGTWILLSIGGIPMAVVLGLLTGLLAFLPNIGSIVSGVLIILVGLSAGGNAVWYAFAVYLAVQLIDGWLIVPMVAKRSVDLAPALVLGAQIILGAAFGFLGLLFADPLVAMLKVALEHRSDAEAQKAAT